MSTPDLVNLASHLSCVIDESPKMKITKILNHQLQQINTSRQKQTLLDSVIVTKEQNIGKEIVTNCFRHLQPSNQHSQVLPILNDRAQETTETLPNPPSD